MPRSRSVLLGLLVLSNVIVLLTGVVWLRYGAALLLMFALPGWAILGALGWLGITDVVERIVVVSGLSLAVSGLLAMFAAYLPGPLMAWQMLLVIDLPVLLIWGVALHRRPPAPDVHWPVKSGLLILLAILLVGGYLRFARLGYTEFREDELENMFIAMRVIDGEEYAPFIDSKGPIHGLVPAAFWVLSDRITEGFARFPFALSGLLAVLAIFAVARRFAGEPVAWIAAALAATTGYNVALSRWIENPMFIFLMSGVAVWLAAHYYRTGDHRSLLLAAFVSAVAVITHWDSLTFLPAILLPPLARLWTHRASRSASPWEWRSELLWAALAALLGLATLATFYVPYVLDPAFADNVAYLADERIGGVRLYDRIARLMFYDDVFNGQYHFPVMVLMWSIAMLMQAWRAGRRWFVLTVVVLAMALSTQVWDSLWKVAGVRLSLLPFALLLGLLVWLPGAGVGWRTVVLWTGVPFWAYNFLTYSAADHTEIALWGGSILAGWGLIALWHLFASRAPAPKGMLTYINYVWRGAVVVTMGAVMFVNLLYILSQYPVTVTRYRQIRDAANAPDSTTLYHRLYGEMPVETLKGGPQRRGWKAFGQLYMQGEFPGEYFSIVDNFKVPMWYTYNTLFSCYPDPPTIVTDRQIDVGSLPPDMQVLYKDHRPVGIVTVEDTPNLYIYHRHPDVTSPLMYRVEDYIAAFDRGAIPDNYRRHPIPQHPVGADFGHQLELLGYDLSGETFQPGQTVWLTLYWRASAQMDARYRVFAHLEGDSVVAQQDDDPLCRLPTTLMHRGQSGLRHLRLVLPGDVSPGEYSLVVGVYNAADGIRLPVLTSDGSMAGDMVVLGTVTVQ
jgi:hypothetical protein